VAGNIDYVKENLRKAAAVKARGASTKVVLRMLRFDYNHGEELKLSSFASDLGLDFEVIEGIGDPKAEHPAIYTDKYLEDALRLYRPDRPQEEAGKVCSLIFGHGNVIDANGVAHLCCAYPNHPAVAIGSFLDLPQEEILLRRYNHPVCASCKIPRRDARPEDKQALLEAMQYRLRTV